MNNSFLFLIFSVLDRFGTIFGGKVVPDSPVPILVRFNLLVPVMLVTVVVGGCDLPDRPKLQPVVPLKTESQTRSDDVENFESPAALDQPSWETWDAYYANNEHIGYSHVESSATTSAKVADVHFELDHRVYQTRGRGRVLQRLVLTSDETNDGRLIGFDGSMQVGLGITQFSGVKDGANLIVEIYEGRSIERREIRWEFNFRGMFAVEQSLRASPMREKGLSRAVKMLISGRYELATARLRCSGRAVVPMLDGTERELNEINVEIEVDRGETIYSAIWTDDQGNVLRTYSPALNIIAYRTDEATATGISNDDLVPVSIEVDGTMKRPRETKRVAYEIAYIGTGDRESTVALGPSPGQFVRASKDGVTQVLVSRRDEIPSGGFVTDELPPTAGDKRSNYFVDSRSEIVTKFAATVGTRKRTKLELARELTETANRMVRPKLERCGLAKASDVARVSAGNCTQSAVLLAALLRARKIPSRIAIGLRFVPESSEPRLRQRMVAHVWTMAHIDDQWVHLDATEGDLAAADRLVFSTTNLSEPNENDAFDSLVREVGQIEIQILAAKH